MRGLVVQWLADAVLGGVGGHSIVALGRCARRARVGVASWPGLSAASSGASVRFPSRRAAACGGRDAARAAGTRWRRLSGFGSLWRRGAHGPPAACRHAVSRAFDRCRWLRTSTRRVRRRGRRGQRSVIDRGRRLVPVMLAINATAPAARLRRRGVVRGRGTRPLNRLKPCPARRLLASNQSRHAGRPDGRWRRQGDVRDPLRTPGQV